MCEVALRMQHYWWYWPYMLLGCLAFGIPVGLIAYIYFGFWTGVGGWVVGALTSGIPFDKFLESRFSILRVQSSHGDRLTPSSHTPCQALPDEEETKEDRQEDAARWERGLLIAVGVLVVLPILYVLSMGPTGLIVYHGGLSTENYRAIYRPLEFLCNEFEAFRVPFGWYLDLWLPSL